MSKSRESGNALIYVLIAIALFAALSFVLSRQTDNSEVSSLSSEKAQVVSGQLIAYAGQVKTALDQMEFSGTDVGNFSFLQPTDPAFETEPPPNIYKVYHPSGGGIVPGTLPEESIIDSPGTDPVAGWYLARFNNVDWTKSTANDVVLVAYQIRQSLCEKINETLTGAATIPVMTDTIPNVFIPDSLHTGTNVAELTTDAAEICPACHGVASLCVQDSAGAYGFYSVVADQ